MKIRISNGFSGYATREPAASLVWLRSVGSTNWPQLQERRIAKGVALPHPLVKSGVDARTRRARPLVVVGFVAEEPQGQGPPASARMGWRTAVQGSRMEQHHVAGLHRPGDDVIGRAIGLDVRQARDLGRVVQGRGVVVQVEARSVIEHAPV